MRLLVSPHVTRHSPYLHLNQRNASGHTDAQHKEIERKQTQFVTDADEDRQ